MITLIIVASLKLVGPFSVVLPLFSSMILIDQKMLITVNTVKIFEKSRIGVLLHSN